MSAVGVGCRHHRESPEGNAFRVSQHSSQQATTTIPNRYFEPRHKNLAAEDGCAERRAEDLLRAFRDRHHENRSFWAAASVVYQMLPVRATNQRQVKHTCYAGRQQLTNSVDLESSLGQLLICRSKAKRGENMQQRWRLDLAPWRCQLDWTLTSLPTFTARVLHRSSRVYIDEF